MNPAKVELNTTPPLETRWLQALSTLLFDRKNINLNGYKQGYVSRRISVRMRVTGCKDLRDYVVHVQREPRELDRLVDAFAINVSGFFRNPEVFEAISGTVFEEWKQRPRRLYWTWSCACAHGEEPYTLSLLWHQWQQRIKTPSEMKIIASDIDPDALAKGMRAVYDERAMESIPRHFHGWLDKQSGGFGVPLLIKKRVQFVQENVLTPAAHPKFDLILCRNFMIFLERSEQIKMFEVLHGSLAESGFLVLGRAESILGNERKGFRVVDPSNRIYQKIT